MRGAASVCFKESQFPSFPLDWDRARRPRTLLRHNLVTNAWHASSKRSAP